LVGPKTMMTGATRGRMTEPESGNGQELAPASEPEVPEVRGSGVPGGGVHNAHPKVEVLDTREHSVSGVQIAGRAVEIRGDSAALVVEILEEWLKQQNRRIEFLRRGGVDPETRRQIQSIQGKLGYVYRLLEAWDKVVQEVGVTVPREDSIAGTDQN